MSSTYKWLSAGTAGVAILLAGWGIRYARSSTALPALPDLQLSEFADSVRPQVERAQRSAHDNPLNATDVAKLGMLLDAYEQHEAAEACYARAAKLDAHDFRWTYYLGRIRALAGRHSEAIESLESALAIRPDYVSARLLLADALFQSGALARAKREYESVVDADANVAAGHYGLGRIHESNGDTAGAVAAYRHASELYSEYGAANYALALLLRRQGSLEEARIYLDRYEQNRNGKPRLHDPLAADIAALAGSALEKVRRAVQLEAAGKLEEAALANEQALQMDPDLMQARVNLVILYGRLNRPEKAEQLYAQASEAGSPEMHYNYSVVAFNRGRYAEAAAALTKAIALNPQYPEARANYGFLLARQGRLEEAEAEYREALKHRPEYPLAHFQLGRLLFARGSHAEAIEHFRLSIEVEDENTPGYMYALGAAYGRTGDRRSAIRFMTTARDRAAALGQHHLVTAVDADLRKLNAMDHRSRVSSR